MLTQRSIAGGVEKFSRNYIWRKITGEIIIEFLEAAAGRPDPIVRKNQSSPNFSISPEPEIGT